MGNRLRIVKRQRVRKSGNEKWKSVRTAKNSKNGFEERERKRKKA